MLRLLYASVIISILLTAFLMAPSVANTHGYWVEANETCKQALIYRLGNPIVQDYLKTQNANHDNLSYEEIIDLDKQWLSELNSNDNRPLIDSVINNKLSEYLKYIKKQSYNTYAEIFIMDNKGLVIAATNPTSDYFQGDEPQWQETFLTGSIEVFIEDSKFDESSGKLQNKCSKAIFDDNTPIGAITVGINNEPIKK